MKVLVTGAGGQMGRDLADLLSGQVPTGGSAKGPWWDNSPPRPGSVEVEAATHQALSVENRTMVNEAVSSLRPDVVFHVGAYTAVDACESDPDRAFAVNGLGTRHLAEACRRYDAHLVYVSTDYVFDGRSPDPYQEWDATNPQSVYGRSKLAGELECPPEATIVRASWVCGAHGANMVKTALRLSEGHGPLRFVDDQRGSPTFTADLASVLAGLGLDRRPGIYHVTNQGSTTWYGFVRAVLAASGGDESRVEPIRTEELDPPRPARRPANSVLDNAALRLSGLPLLPDWMEGLDRLVAALHTGKAA